MSKKKLLIAAAILAASLAVYGGARWRSFLSPPRSRLAPDAAFPEMPPDERHRYITLPIDHKDPSKGSFRSFYVLSPGFSKDKSLIFFLYDGQQEMLSVPPDLSDFDKYLGGLSYAVVRWRGHSPVLLPEVYGGAGRADLAKALDLYGSHQAVEDVEAVRRDMVAQGLLRGGAKIMLIGASGGGVFVQQYLSKYGRHVSRAVLMSTGAPDLAREQGSTFLQGLADYDQETARELRELLSRRGGRADPNLMWLLFRVGIRSDGPGPMLEIIRSLKDGRRLPYWKRLCTPWFNFPFVRLLFRSPLIDAGKARIFEIAGPDLMSYVPGKGQGIILQYEWIHVILSEFVEAARRGDIRVPELRMDRAAFRGQVLVVGGDRDFDFAPEAYRAMGGAYFKSRVAIIRGGHHLFDDATVSMCRAFFEGGLESAEFLRRYDKAVGGPAGPPDP